MTGENWKNEGIPDRQFEIVEKELEELRKGRPHQVWENVCTAINETVKGTSLKILDVGCASGYYYEVFQKLLVQDIEYTGSDYSDSMLKLAKKNYPGCSFVKLDIRNIELPDKSYECVFSSAVLEHVPEWKRGLKELCRIAGTHLILSKMPTTNKAFRTEQREIYGGVAVCFNKFNHNEVLDIVAKEGFELLHERPTHSGSNNPYKILIFKRKGVDE